MQSSADAFRPVRMLGAIEGPRMSIRVILAACVLVVSLVAVTAALPWLERRGREISREELPVYLPKTEYLRAMSLGYENVLADVLWFRTINYFGRQFRSDRTYPWLAHMCDRVTDLDPRAEHVYRFAGMILPWEAGQAEEGIRLLEKGLRVFPDSWLLHYWVGFNYYFFKNDLARAATHLRTAAGLPDAHPNAARLAAVLAAESYGPEVTLRFLNELRTDVDSPEMREVVERQIKEAHLARDVERLSAAARAYQDRYGHPPDRIEALVEAKLVDRIPNEPFGGRYEILPTGEVTSSSGHAPSKLHRSRLRDKHLRGESVRDF